MLRLATMGSTKVVFVTLYRNVALTQWYAEYRTALDSAAAVMLVESLRTSFPADVIELLPFVYV